MDSDHRPTPYEDAALTAVLLRQKQMPQLNFANNGIGFSSYNMVGETKLNCYEKHLNHVYIFLFSLWHVSWHENYETRGEGFQSDCQSDSYLCDVLFHLLLVSYQDEFP